MCVYATTCNWLRVTKNHTEQWRKTQSIQALELEQQQNSKTNSSNTVLQWRNALNRTNSVKMWCLSSKKCIRKNEGIKNAWFYTKIIFLTRWPLMYMLWFSVIMSLSNVIKTFAYNVKGVSGKRALAALVKSRRRFKE